MDTKLTLKLNERVIERAKQYAKENNISLSRMIENYLQAVTSRKRNKVKISPLVESLTGVIDLKNTDYKKDYTDFLSKKYS
jgi:dsDNA-specific endonuclease/ATPase MutS2